jgi:hypothetical protein
MGLSFMGLAVYLEVPTRSEERSFCNPQSQNMTMIPAVVVLARTRPWFFT